MHVTSGEKYRQTRKHACGLQLSDYDVDIGIHTVIMSRETGKVTYISYFVVHLAMSGNIFIHCIALATP